MSFTGKRLAKKIKIKNIPTIGRQPRPFKDGKNNMKFSTQSPPD